MWQQKNNNWTVFCEYSLLQIAHIQSQNLSSAHKTWTDQITRNVQNKCALQMYLQHGLYTKQDKYQDMKRQWVNTFISKPISNRESQLMTLQTQLLYTIHFSVQFVLAPKHMVQLQLFPLKCKQCLHIQHHANLHHSNKHKQN